MSIFGKDLDFYATDMKVTKKELNALKNEQYDIEKLYFDRFKQKGEGNDDGDDDNEDEEDGEEDKINDK